MLTKEELIEIASFNNLKPWQQEKHYIQSLALIALAGESLAFKGGTYLWFFHGLNRFSEDLDFTAKENINDKKIIGKVSRFLEQNGVENDYKILTNNENGFSFRISAVGPLCTNYKNRTFLYIEISTREKLLEKPVAFTLNTVYKLPVKIISGMDLKELASEKVRAIMTRNKARDIYDSWFLAKKGIKPSKKMVEEKLVFYKKKFNCDLFHKNLKEKKVFYSKELKPMVFEALPSFEEAKKIIEEKWF
jgi:predicted nucleotidyltransferase component of viral defense system